MASNEGTSVARIEEFFHPLSVVISGANVLIVANIAFLFGSSKKFSILGIELEGLNQPAVMTLSGIVMAAAFMWAVFYGQSKNMALLHRITFVGYAEQIALGSLVILNGKIRYEWKSEIDNEFDKRNDKVLYNIAILFKLNIWFILICATIFQVSVQNYEKWPESKWDLFSVVFNFIWVAWVYNMLTWWIRDAGGCLYQLEAYARKRAQSPVK